MLLRAERLWPQGTKRYSYPKRMDWIIDMVDAGARIVLVADPSFIPAWKEVRTVQKIWNSRKLEGMVEYTPLPAAPSSEELVAVARKMLPHVSEKKLSWVAEYSKAYHYISTIAAIAKHARSIDKLEGRDVVTDADVNKARKESAIPENSNLEIALADEPLGGKKTDKNKPTEGKPQASDATPAVAAAAPIREQESMAPAKGAVPCNRLSGSGASLPAPTPRLPALEDLVTD
jgi:hypothetical protein